MDDIAPALLEKIRAAFLVNLKKSVRAAELLRQIGAGTAGYAQAGDYAYEIGSALADAFRSELSAAALPDGRMYQNIAEKVVAPLLGENRDLVSSAAVQVQQALNEAAGIGLKAQAAPLDTDRVRGIVRKVANASSYDDVSWALDEPVRTFSQAVVDDTLKRNAEFQSKAGLRPRIIRRAEFRCCEWCSQMEGTYTYPDVPEDVYRRHERCRCVVEYDPGSGKQQNVWSKKWTTREERANIKPKYAPSPQRNAQGIQVGHAKYARLTGTMNTQFPGLSPEDGKRVIFDAEYGYVVAADGYGGLTIIRRFKLE